MKLQTFLMATLMLLAELGCKEDEESKAQLVGPPPVRKKPRERSAVFNSKRVKKKADACALLSKERSREHPTFQYRKVVLQQPIKTAEPLNVVARGKLGEVVVKDEGNFRKLYLKGKLPGSLPIAPALKIPLEPVTGLLNHFGGHMRRTYLVGLGTGFTSSHLSHYGHKVDAVEIEPNIARFASKYFGYKGKVVVADGLAHLEKSWRIYDNIVVDAFIGQQSPGHFFTPQALATYRHHLFDQGLLLFRLIASPSDANYKKLIATLVKHLGSAFAYGQNGGPRRQTIYLLFQPNRKWDESDRNRWRWFQETNPLVPISSKYKRAASGKLPEMTITGYLVKQAFGPLSIYEPLPGMCDNSFWIRGSIEKLQELVAPETLFPTNGGITIDGFLEETLVEVGGKCSHMGAQLRYSPYVVQVRGTPNWRYFDVSKVTGILTLKEWEAFKKQQKPLYKELTKSMDPEGRVPKVILAKWQKALESTFGAWIKSTFTYTQYTDGWCPMDGDECGEGRRTAWLPVSRYQGVSTKNPTSFSPPSFHKLREEMVKAQNPDEKGWIARIIHHFSEKRKKEFEGWSASLTTDTLFKEPFLIVALFDNKKLIEKITTAAVAQKRKSLLNVIDWLARKLFEDPSETLRIGRRGRIVAGMYSFTLSEFLFTLMKRHKAWEMLPYIVNETSLENLWSDPWYGAGLPEGDEDQRKSIQEQRELHSFFLKQANSIPAKYLPYMLQLLGRDVLSPSLLPHIRRALTRNSVLAYKVALPLLFRLKMLKAKYLQRFIDLYGCDKMFDVWLAENLAVHLLQNPCVVETGEGSDPEATPFFKSGDSKARVAITKNTLRTIKGALETWNSHTLSALRAIKGLGKEGLPLAPLLLELLNKNKRYQHHWLYDALGCTGVNSTMIPALMKHLQGAYVHGAMTIIGAISMLPEKELLWFRKKENAWAVALIKRWSEYQAGDSWYRLTEFAKTLLKKIQAGAPTKR